MFKWAMDLSARQALCSMDDMASPPMVVDTVVFYAGTDGTVHSRDLSSGDEVFRLGE